MKKIMFNDKYGLTTAVLEGRKTMTRRVITIPEKWHGIEVYGFCHVKGQAALELTDGDDFCIEDPRTGQCAQILPTYKIGEEVAIAQNYKTCWNYYKAQWESRQTGTHQTQYSATRWKIQRDGQTRCSSRPNTCPTASASQASRWSGCRI